MNLLITIVAFLFTLGVLITVHELGHYWAARLCRVKVLRFSIGFGRPLLQWVRGVDRTQWVVSAIPLGGYVRMLDETDPHCESITKEERWRAFNRQTVWRRGFIVLAGPVSNLVLAVLVYWVLMMVGTAEPKAVLAQPPEHTMAWRAGVTRGDAVTEFNGVAVQSYNELRWHLLKAAITQGSFEFLVQDAGGGVRSRTITIDGEDIERLEGDVVGQMGFALDTGAPKIHGVAPDSPAQRAGFHVGDLILSIDGVAIEDARAVRQIIVARPGSIFQIDILRDGQSRRIEVQADDVVDAQGRHIGQLGIAFAPIEWTHVRYGPLSSLVRAVTRTGETVTFSLKMLGRMLMGTASWKNISGPVTIADYAGQSASIGLAAYLNFLALISISLGVLNLLPIPLLDGGHLLYYAAEILMGGPPAQWVVAWGQRAGVAALLMLTALALYNDLMRLLS